MTASFDDLLAELSQIVVTLADEGGLGPDDRPRLEARRDELREALRAVDMDRQRPTAELLEERHRLEVRLNEARGERVKKAGTKHLGATNTVGGGVVPEEINRLIDEGNRFEELLARHERITEILESREDLE